MRQIFQIGFVIYEHWVRLSEVGGEWMKRSFLFFSITFANLVWAQCQVFNSNGTVASAKGDLLFGVLSKQEACPQSSPALKELFEARSLKVKPGMVANRGRNNPKFGSFSFFETVTGKESREGDLFFGHFTGAEDGEVVLDQAPAPGKLLIELIAWDEPKGLYNFYELIGTRTGGTWFYRGDSKDALTDNLLAHEGKFGGIMRCSGCHVSGGPIMKELAAPHNDWWREKRLLPFEPNRLSGEVASWMKNIIDAEDFARAVSTGIDRLETSKSYREIADNRPLRARLRPLFCEAEINLVSSSDDEGIEIPSESLVSPLLATAKVSITRADYDALLKEFKLRFPENNAADADHAWLTPVKGRSDLLALQAFDPELVADVLAIDMAKPLFSSRRCGLLKHVPVTAGANWKADLIASLAKDNSTAAQDLHANLTNESRDRAFHQKAAEDFLARVAQISRSPEGRRALFQSLIETRQAAFDSVISKNPKGQILEPGFRVIFPVPR